MSWSFEQDAWPVLQNIHVAFQELGTQVTRVLRTQLGDAAHLNEQKRICLQFLAHIQQVRIDTIYYGTHQGLDDF